MGRLIHDVVAGEPDECLYMMLQRFVPIGVREPEFTVKEIERKQPLGPSAVALRGIVGALVIGAFGVFAVALLAALKTMRATPGAGFDLNGALWQVAHPVSIPDWTQLVGIAAFAVIGGLFVAAVAVARRGAGAADAMASDLGR